MTPLPANEVDDLSNHASDQALRAVCAVADLLPIGYVPSLYQVAGFRLVIQAAAYAAALRQADASLIEDFEHPETIKLVRAYGEALQAYPHSEAMLAPILAALTAPGCDGEITVESFVFPARRAAG